MDELHPDLTSHEKSFVWRAPDFELVGREARWYVWSIVIASALVLVALFVQKNLLFALFVIIAEAMLLFLSWQTPRVRRYGLSEKGVYAEENLIVEYAQLKGFAIADAGGEHLELVLRYKARHKPYLKLLLPRELEQTIRELCSTAMPEFTYTPHVAELFARRLGL